MILIDINVVGCEPFGLRKVGFMCVLVWSWLQ
jgi:hypothetical protein